MTRETKIRIVIFVVGLIIGLALRQIFLLF